MLGPSGRSCDWWRVCWDLSLREVTLEIIHMYRSLLHYYIRHLGPFAHIHDGCPDCLIECKHKGRSLQPDSLKRFSGLLPLTDSHDIH
jgi:hypothetical protein